MKLYPAVPSTLSLMLILTVMQGCKKEEVETPPGPPYYQFTADDLQWLNLKEGDTWTFATSTGKQQRYIVLDVKEEINRPYSRSNFGGIVTGASEVSYYDDRVSIEIKRLDTVEYNSFEYRRTIPTGADNRSPPAGKGEFKFGGSWGNYIGGSLYTGLFGNLNVAPYQLLPNRGFSEVINGKMYDNIIVITPDQASTFVIGNRKPYIKALYYAQKEGVVRMVSTKNEVWDRLP